MWIDFSTTPNFSQFDNEIAWQREIVNFWEEWNNDDDYIVVNTSGSTSEPKPIKLPKSAFLASAQGTIDFFKLKQGQSALLVLPVKFIAGKMMIIRAMQANMKLYCIEPKLELANLPNIDFAAMTPTQCKKSLQEIPKIKIVLLGGETVPRNLKEELKFYDTDVYESYGMTETVTHVALKNIKTQDYFQTLESVKIETNENGCLVLEVPYVSKEKIKTNDLVQILTPNTFEWIGRKDNVINSGGVKIAVEPLENRIWDNYGIEAIMFGVENQEFGESVEMIINKVYDFQEADWQHMNWTKIAIPKKIYVVEAFEKTENGKVDRKKTIKKVKKIF